MVKSQVMDTWAVIKTGGKQYKVKEGQTVAIEKLGLVKDKTVTFDQVLALGGEKTLIGMPQVEKAKVQAKVVEFFKDKKIIVVKFKPKSRYLRTRGHRQNKTKVLIEKIII